MPINYALLDRIQAKIDYERELKKREFLENAKEEIPHKQCIGFHKDEEYYEMTVNELKMIRQRLEEILAELKYK